MPPVVHSQRIRGDRERSRGASERAQTAQRVGVCRGRVERERRQSEISADASTLARERNASGAEGAKQKTQRDDTMAGSFISSHTRLSVFCTYFAPWMPVSLLKYLSVGQPPWPACCQHHEDCFEANPKSNLPASPAARAHAHTRYTVGGVAIRTWCFCMSSLDSLQLTSANATLSLGGNLSYTAFQPGCCFIHQPHLQQRVCNTRPVTPPPNHRRAGGGGHGAHRH